MQQPADVGLGQAGGGAEAHQDAEDSGPCTSGGNHLYQVGEEVVCWVQQTFLWPIACVRVCVCVCVCVPQSDLSVLLRLCVFIIHHTQKLTPE